MAKLIVSPEEEASLSYLDWDDASLAAVARYVALHLKNLSDDAEGWKKMTAASIAVMLVSTCVQNGATTMRLRFSGHTRAGKATGDWKVVVKRTLTPAEAP